MDNEMPAGPADVSETKVNYAMTLAPPMVQQSYAIDDAKLQSFSNDPRVVECLKKFEFKDVSFKLLAEHVGFSGEEMKMLDIFWEPTFNNSWIYLSPEIVMNDLGYASVPSFRSDVLVGRGDEKQYIEDVDWKEVPETHELIVAWKKYTLEKSRVTKSTRKGGIAIKHYIARGKAFKKMLMRAGKADRARDYFLKVEDLAILMREFMNGLLKYNNFLKDEQILNQNSKISKLEAQTAGVNQQKELIDQIASSMSIKKHTGWLYIATSPQDLAVNHFKIGITENLERRLDSYSSTFSTPATKVFYCDYWSLHEPKMVEKMSKVILKSYHLKDAARKKQDETYILNYDILHNIVSQLCAGYTSVVDIVNKQLPTYKTDITKPSTVIPKPLPKAILCIEMKITADDQTVTIPLDLDAISEAERTAACKNIINGYIRATTTHKSFDISSDQKEVIDPRIKIEWPDLEKFIKKEVPYGKKTKVKSTAWKRIVSSMLTGIKNIEYSGKKPK